MQTVLWTLAMMSGAGWAQDASRVTVATLFDLDGGAADPEAVLGDTALVDNTSFSGLTDPDVCRPLDLTLTDVDGSVTAGTLTVTGTDCLGDVVVASYTFDGSGTGVKALSRVSGQASGPYFRTVTSIETDTLTGEGRADTVSVGFDADCPTQYLLFGVRQADRMKRRWIDPYVANTQTSPVTTSGALTAELTSYKGGAFDNVDVGDLLLFTLDGVDYERLVVAKADDDSVTLDRPVAIEGRGISFRWQKPFVSSDPGDGLWFDVTRYASVAFLFDQDAESSTGDLITVVECRAGRPTIATDTQTLDGDTTGVSTVDLLRTPYDECRVGLRFGTGDDADTVPEVLHVSMLGQLR